MIKITDLEKFVLEQIFRPYQTEIGIPEDRNGIRLKLNKEYNLETVLPLFKQYPRWEELVVDRIKRINFYFPKYINHKLVDYLRNKSETSK